MYFFRSKHLCNTFLLRPPGFLKVCRSKSIDFSKFPILHEKELHEQFIRGHGPGGSAVNKTSNCVLLKHLTTGIVVRCHDSRLQHKNREIAREILRAKLDDLINGEMSVSAQKRRIEESKSSSQQKKAKKLRDLKASFKKREGLD